MFHTSSRGLPCRSGTTPATRLRRSPRPSPVHHQPGPVLGRHRSHLDPRDHPRHRHRQGLHRRTQRRTETPTTLRCAGVVRDRHPTRPRHPRRARTSRRPNHLRNLEPVTAHSPPKTATGPSAAPPVDPPTPRRPRRNPRRRPSPFRQKPSRHLRHPRTRLDPDHLLVGQDRPDRRPPSADALLAPVRGDRHRRTTHRPTTGRSSNRDG